MNHWFRYRCLRAELRFSLWRTIILETIPHWPELLYKNSSSTASEYQKRSTEERAICITRWYTREVEAVPLLLLCDSQIWRPLTFDSRQFLGSPFGSRSADEPLSLGSYAKCVHRVSSRHKKILHAVEHIRNWRIAYFAIKAGMPQLAASLRIVSHEISARRSGE